MRSSFLWGVVASSAFNLGKLSPLVWWKGDDPDSSINSGSDPDGYISIPNRGSWGGSVEQLVGSREPDVATVGPLNAPGFYDNGHRLEADGSGITLARLARLHNGTDSATFYAKIRVDEVISNGYLFDSKVSSVGPGLALANTAGNWSIQIGNGSASQTIDSGVAQTLGWHDVFYVKTGSSVQLFVDGVEVISSTAITSPSADDAQSGFWGQFAGFSRQFEGLFAENAIFPTALTAAERGTVASKTQRWLDADI